jgi:hypothetical protein
VSEGSESRNRSFLDRHWPLAIIVLTLAVLCFLYFGIYPTKESSSRALLLAVLPELAASLLTAAGLYLLLNRDFRAIRSTTGRQDPSHGLLSEIDSLAAMIQRLSDESGILKTRSMVPTLRSMFDGAETISIAAVSGLGLVNHNRGLLEEQLRLGRKVRVMLLDADHGDALSAWDRLSNPPMNTPEEDIRSSLRMLVALASLREYPGICQVKVSDTLFPWSLIICSKPEVSQLQIELHAHRRAPEERPNILLTDKTDAHWFQFFSQQFELAWSNARSAIR